MTFRHITRPLLALALALGASSSLQSSVLEHERLRVRNVFKTPEEVVSYYCARDASGFVWSGLLESERRAFTLWPEVPEMDSFYIATKYEIQPAQKSQPDEAEVEVLYQVSAIGDAHGTRTPAPEPVRKVVFSLKKVSGQWKIAQPAPQQIAPVVLESKFVVTR